MQQGSATSLKTLEEVSHLAQVKSFDDKMENVIIHWRGEISRENLVQNG